MHRSLDFCLSKLEELPVTLQTTEAVCWLVGAWSALHPASARRLVERAGIGQHSALIRLGDPRIPDGVYVVGPDNQSWLLFSIKH